MTKELRLFFDNFDKLAESPGGIQKLRELILRLAVQGKLVPQDPDDEPASELLKRIKAKKEKLIKEGKIKKQKPLPPIEPDEIPYILPKSWATVRLGELLYNGQTSYGQNPSSVLVNAKVVKVSNISNDGFFHGHFAVRGYTPSIISELLVSVGDLLVVKSSGSAENVRSGKTALCGPEEADKIVGSNFVMRLQRFSDDVDTTFLWRLLNSPISRRFVQETVKTFTYPNLKWSDLSQWVIGLPPLAEQKRIVAKVDELMALCDELEQKQQKAKHGRIVLNNSAIDHLLDAEKPKEFNKHWQLICENFDLLYDDLENVNKLRQAILQLAVQGKLVKQNTNDEPASELLRKIKAEKEKLIKEGKIKKQKPFPPIDVDEVPYKIPKEWRWVRFGQLINSMTNGIYKPSKYYSEDGVGCLRMYNIQDGRFNLINLKRMILTEQELEQYRLEKNNLLVNRVNSRELVGKTAIIDELVEPLIFESKNIRVCCSENSVFPYYANIFMRTREVRSAFEGDAKQTCGQASISQPQIASLLLPLPPLAEQKRIVRKVDELMALCDQLEEKIKQSQAKSEILMAATIHHVLVA